LPGLKLQQWRSRAFRTSRFIGTLLFAQDPIFYISILL
jgi:hypothetical protein